MARRKSGPVKTGAQAAAAWKTAMSAATTATNWINGVQQTTVNPFQLATTEQARAKYAAGTAAAAQPDGAFTQNTQSVSPADWKAAVKTAGSAALTNGANKKAAKVARIYNDWASVWQQQRNAAQQLRASGADWMQIMQVIVQLAKEASGKNR